MYLNGKLTLDKEKEKIIMNYFKSYNLLEPPENEDSFVKYDTKDYSVFARIEDVVEDVKQEDLKKVAE